VDFVPPEYVFQPNGLKCPCGARKNMIYSFTTFPIHIKTSKHHKKWIESKNINKNNILQSHIELEQKVREQSRLIAEQAIKIQQLKFKNEHIQQTLNTIVSYANKRNILSSTIEDDNISIITNID
jgi:flagellar motor component MotA